MVLFLELSQTGQGSGFTLRNSELRHEDFQGAEEWKGTSELISESLVGPVAVTGVGGECLQ